MSMTTREKALSAAGRTLFLAADQGSHDDWDRLDGRGRQPWISQAAAVVTTWQNESLGDATYKEVFRALHYASESTYDMQNQLHEAIGQTLYDLFGVQKHVDTVLGQIEDTKAALITAVGKGQP